MQSPTSHHVNMTPRSKSRPSRAENASNVSNIAMAKLEAEINQKDSTISAMANRIEILEKQLLAGKPSLMTRSPTKPTGTQKFGGESIQKRVHPLTHVQHVIGDEGKRKDDAVGRSSLATSHVLDALEAKKNAGIATPEKNAKKLAKKFLKAFNRPRDHVDYLNSHNFAAEILEVCDYVTSVFEPEPRCVFLQSPCYVFGDIHGNLEDLHFFSDNVWKLGMDITAGSFLFLGDYVDRGRSGIECVAYLFALKALYPHKIFLLRGNHEVRDVNGWEEHYGDKSFIYQCKERFGAAVGETVWEKVNCVFDRLPLSGVIDHDIFCIHGGIPRQISRRESEIEAIMKVPKVATVMPAGPTESENVQQVCLDCLWSDPAPEEMEPSLDSQGFGESPRGGGAICFGNAALDNFLKRNNLSYVIRAHEAHAQGVALSKSARVFTVFSTSKDHRQGQRAMAGCVLVDVDDIKVINRSHKYKNKYVHRRSSVSLQGMDKEEVERRRRLGLVRTSMGARPRIEDSTEDENEDDEDNENENIVSGNVAVAEIQSQTNGSERRDSKGGSIFHSFVPTWLTETI